MDRCVARSVRKYANGVYTYFTYDSHLHLETVKDPNGNITRYVYNDAGKVTQEIDPLGNAKQFFYDAAQRLTEVIDRNGRSRRFILDPLGRTLYEEWRDTNSVLVRTLAYVYDPVGNIIATSDPDSSYTFTFDALNRMLTQDNAGTPGIPNVILTYTYDAVGNKTSVTDNFGVTVTFTYDSRNLLKTLVWSGGGIDPASVQMDYNGRMQMTEMRRYMDRSKDTHFLVFLPAYLYNAVIDGAIGYW